MAWGQSDYHHPLTADSAALAADLNLPVAGCVPTGGPLTGAAVGPCGPSKVNGSATLAPRRRTSNRDETSRELLILHA